MGNIRSTHIKILADRLLEVYPDKFSTDFNKNKEVIDELLNFESKIQRNKIAGYITHTLDKMEKLKTIKVTYQNPNLNKRKRGKKTRGRR